MTLSLIYIYIYMRELERDLKCWDVICKLSRRLLVIFSQYRGPISKIKPFILVKFLNPI